MGRKSNLRKALYVVYDVFMCFVMLLAFVLIVPVVAAALMLMFCLYYAILHAPGMFFGDYLERVRGWFSWKDGEEELW